MNRKNLSLAMVAILTALVALGFALQEQALWLLGAIFFTTYTLGCIGAGFWLGQYSFKEGARVTLDAQRVNDEWDVAKTQALSRFGSEVVKMARTQQTDPGLPPLLLEDGKTIDADFVFNGFDGLDGGE